MGELVTPSLTHGESYWLVRGVELLVKFRVTCNCQGLPGSEVMCRHVDNIVKRKRLSQSGEKWSF